MKITKKPHVVFVKIDTNGYITAVNSSAFLQDSKDWTEIDRGFGDRYHHAQGNYFPKPISTADGAYRYKLETGEAVECTAEEITKQTPKEFPARKAMEDRVAALEKGISDVKNLLSVFLGKTMM